MNPSIIQKCLDELQKDDFRKDYVIGLLEALVQLSGTKVAPTSYVPTTSSGSSSIPAIEEPADSLAARYAGGPIGKLS